MISHFQILRILFSSSKMRYFFIHNGFQMERNEKTTDGIQFLSPPSWSQNPVESQDALWIGWDFITHTTDLGFLHHTMVRIEEEEVMMTEGERTPVETDSH